MFTMETALTVDASPIHHRNVAVVSYVRKLKNSDPHSTRKLQSAYTAKPLFCHSRLDLSTGSAKVHVSMLAKTGGVGNEMVDRKGS